MNLKKASHPKSYVLRMGFIIGFFAIVLWGYLMPQDVTIYNRESFSTLTGGWTQHTAEADFPLDDYHHYNPPKDGAPIVLSHTVTQDMVGQCLFFYAQHQEVSVTAEDQTLYTLTCPSALQSFGSPGRTWVKVPISQDLVGSTLQLTFSSPFPLYQGVPTHLYLVEESRIYAVQVDFLLLRNTIALVMLVLALVSYTNGFLWKQQPMRRFLFAMADVYLIVGLWLCAEVNVLAIWLGRAPMSAVLAHIFTRVLPVVFYYFFKASLPYTSWKSKLAQGLVWTNLLGSLLLQVCFGVSLIDLVGFNVAVIVLCCILGFWEIVQLHRTGMAFFAFGPSCSLSGLLLVAGLLECYIYCHDQTQGQWMGIPLSAACLLYFVLIHMYLVSNQSTTSQAKQQLEQAVADLRKAPLQQQINAHFLYNSLNAVAAFCKTDGDKAYEAIRLMGQYLRSYTYLVGTTKNIPLEDELDLMQTYMAMQNLRFQGGLTLTICNNCDDVTLPPLLLQPVVENAVNHGIRKGASCGHISILANYRYHMVEITVTDDGVGFVPGQKPKGSGVGLSNLNARILALGGHMTVDSRPGHGTTVTLQIPETKE